jgi:hypothetical protein
MYIMGSVHIAVMCAIKPSAIEVTSRHISVYILGSVLIPAMCAIRHSAKAVT